MGCSFFSSSPRKRRDKNAEAARSWLPSSPMAALLRTLLLGTLVVLASCGGPPGGAVSGGADPSRRPLCPPFAPGSTSALDRPSILVQRGHAASIHRVALSDDGRIMATMSPDGTLLVWDTTTGLLLRRLLTSGFAAQVTLSGTGDKIAYAGANPEAAGAFAILLVDLAAGGPPRRVTQFGQIALSPDGKTMAVGINTVDLYDTETLAKIKSVDVHQPSGVHLGVAFDRAGKRLAIASVGEVEIIDVPSFSLAQRVPRSAALGDTPIGIDLTGDTVVLRNAAGTVELISLGKGAPGTPATLPGRTLDSAAGGGRAWVLASPAAPRRCGSRRAVGAARAGTRSERRGRARGGGRERHDPRRGERRWIHRGPRARRRERGGAHRHAARWKEPSPAAHLRSLHLGDRRGGRAPRRLRALHREHARRAHALGSRSRNLDPPRDGGGVEHARGGQLRREGREGRGLRLRLHGESARRRERAALAPVEAPRRSLRDHGLVPPRNERARHRRRRGWREALGSRARRRRLRRSPSSASTSSTRRQDASSAPSVMACVAPRSPTTAIGSPTTTTAARSVCSTPERARGAGSRARRASPAEAEIAAGSASPRTGARCCSRPPRVPWGAKDSVLRVFDASSERAAPDAAHRHRRADGRARRPVFVARRPASAPARSEDLRHARADRVVRQRGHRGRRAPEPRSRDPRRQRRRDGDRGRDERASRWPSSSPRTAATSSPAPPRAPSWPASTARDRSRGSSARRWRATPSSSSPRSTSGPRPCAAASPASRPDLAAPLAPPASSCDLEAPPPARVERPQASRCTPP
jgi:hypothetical protein